MQKNKIFLDQKWATHFLATRFKKYWPGAKKILALKIEPVKNFLNYLRFTLRYRIFIEMAHGKMEGKRIIIKTEREKKFKFPPRIGRVQRDYLATRFLARHGLGNILPRPLEFYKPLLAYLYEETEGATLKSFIQKDVRRVNLFYEAAPRAIRALKKIHAVKEKPPYANGNHKKIIEDGIREWLTIILKYYPAGRARAKMAVSALGKIEKKYKNILFDRKKYRLIHGDFQSDNIIIGKHGKISFIDFADSKFFNPLDDLASFLTQSEMHFKYVRPDDYKNLTEKLRKIVYAAYFGRKVSREEELQVEFFSAKDTLRIATFVSFTQKAWQTVHDHSKMMDALLDFAEQKIKNLGQKYL